MNGIGDNIGQGAQSAQAALGIEVPAARITYTVNISPGRTLACEMLVDQTIANEDLDEIFDRFTRSWNRQQAILELPDLERHRDNGNLLLKEKIKDRAAMPMAHEARLDALRREKEEAAAKIEQPRGNRRNPRSTPADQSRLAQVDHQIAELEQKHIADLDIADKDIAAMRLQIDWHDKKIREAKALIGHTNPNLHITALAAE